MNVALGKYYEDFIKEQIASGRYGNASEVVRAALRGLERQEQEAVLRISDLDSKLVEGLRCPSGPMTSADLERIRSRTQRKLAKLEAA